MELNFIESIKLLNLLIKTSNLNAKIINAGGNLQTLPIYINLCQQSHKYFYSTTHDLIYQIFVFTVIQAFLNVTLVTPNDMTDQEKVTGVIIWFNAFLIEKTILDQIQLAMSTT